MISILTDYNKIFKYIIKQNKRIFINYDDAKLNLFFKLFTFLKDIEEEIKLELIHIYNLRVELKFERNEKSDNYTCYYDLYNPENLDQKLKNKQFKDIIFNEELIGLFDLINEINNEKYKNIKYKKYFYESPNNIIVKNTNNNSKVLLLKNLTKMNKEDNYKIDYIKKINSDYYIVKAIKKDDQKNYLFLYDKSDSKKIQIYIEGDSDYTFFTHKINNNIVIIFVCSGSYLDIIEYNINSNKINRYKREMETIHCNVILEYKKKHIIGGKNGAFSNTDIKNKKTKNEKIINDEYIKGGIKINDFLFAFISNNIDSNAKNMIKFYNMDYTPSFEDNLYKHIYEIKDYSISASPNGLLLMDIEQINHKLLLCACNNGILLITIIGQNISEAFFVIKDFIIFCFCQIQLIDDYYIFKKEETKTLLFLIGGYDKNKHSGLIKLYEVIIGTDNKYKIEFINDIIINNNKYNNEDPITSIIQNEKYLIFSTIKDKYKIEFDIDDHFIS